MSQQLIKIAPGLFLCENYWSTSQCKVITDELAKSQEWKNATILNYEALGEVDQSVRNQKILRTACKEQKTQFSLDMVKYASLLDVTTELIPHLLEYQITEPGGFFGWHPDYYEGSERVLSCLLYLSDAETHDLIGGSTEFVIDDELVEFEPKAGSFVLFDPKIIHRGAEVISGIKYSLLVIYKTNCGCQKHRQLNRNSNSMVRELASQNG